MCVGGGGGATHERSGYAEATLKMADMLINSDLGTWHRNDRPVEIQKSDHKDCDTQDAISGFTTPFSLNDNDYLYCLF